MKATIVFLLLTASLTFAQPWTPHVIWDRSGAGDSSRYGYTILPLGDQNNDGFADWAVYAAGGTGDPPLLEFFHGGNQMPAQPYLIFHGVQSGEYIYPAGDVDGDGYTDWMTWCAIDNSHTIAHIYLGGPSADTLSDWTVSTTGEFGGWLVALGDFNGDGYDDVGFYHFTGDYIDIFFGGNPTDTIPDWTLHSPESARYQAAAISHGDLNGDGYSDWVSCTSNSNTTYIFLGGANPDTVPAYAWPGMAYQPQGIVKDLNGDSYDDLIYRMREHVEVHFGGPILHSEPDMILNFPCEESGPTYVTTAGDINGDHFNDLIMASEHCLDNDWGVLSLHLGYHWLNVDPILTIPGWTPPLNLIGIWTAVGLGDVNGDHIDDIAIGALDNLAYLGWRGRVVILAGDSTIHVPVEDPIILHPSSFNLSVFPNPFNPTTTISFTLPKTGEVNMAVYDVLGRASRGIEGEHMGSPLQAGEHHIPFDGSALPSGVYFVHVQAGNHQQTLKLLLLK